MKRSFLLLAVAVLPGLSFAQSVVLYANDFESPNVPIVINCPNSLDTRGTRSRRNRLLRRGIPYLEPPAPDGVPAGLLFMAFCTNLGRQFEFVQRAWLNDGNVFGLVDQPDVFAGQRGNIVRAKPRLNAVLPRLVTTKDGEYFFVPSVAAINKIAMRAFA